MPAMQSEISDRILRVEEIWTDNQAFEFTDAQSENSIDGWSRPEAMHAKAALLVELGTRSRLNCIKR